MATTLNYVSSFVVFLLFLFVIMNMFVIKIYVTESNKKRFRIYNMTFGFLNVIWKRFHHLLQGIIFI